MLRPTRMEVDLKAIRHNYRQISSYVGGRAQVMCVVKANAYGLGARKVAESLRAEGVTRFGVAIPDEAVQLREWGFGEPILVLGQSLPSAAGEMVARDVACAVGDMAFAEAMSSEAKRQGRQGKLHVKVDTGMGRIGFLPQEAEEAAAQIMSMGNLDVEGVFTHFSTADESRLSFAEEQFKRFGDVLDRMRSRGFRFRLRHACNSAALIRMPHAHLDAVRPGILLYGMRPSPVCPVPLDLKVPFQVKTQVVAVRELPPMWGVSYGMRYVTRGKERIAVLPIGYRDGYLRCLGGKAQVLIGGRRFPVVGTICMDQCMVDVTDDPSVKVGDEVVILGSQGGEAITPEEFAAWLGTIVYEVPGIFSERVPRVYISEE
ncbi:MAG: alanine racemase [Thermanaerothrix sp.]|nr:alanine racemase [Thermanaerothrix sp.]